MSETTVAPLKLPPDPHNPVFPDLVIGVTPLGRPDPGLCLALVTAGALGVLDLGLGDRDALTALEVVGRSAPAPFGVRIGADCGLRPEKVFEYGDVATVVLGAHSAWRIADVPDGRRVLAEVTSLQEARRAIDGGAEGLIAKGSEGGGAVSSLSSFVLLQQLLGEVEVPVWARGGIGPRSAAAAVIGGAAGVVLDTQLALLTEADTDPIAAAVLSLGDAIPDPGSLPIGQDAFLAKWFSDRYRGTPRAVATIRASIIEACHASAEDSGLAAALGTRLPVAQGPMTRVSDVAGFAAAVADAGGLPFLALAQSTGEQARTLLETTRAELGDRPWGVGVLGFVPDDLREAQMGAIAAVRPRVALVAGGRPAHVAGLEALGVSTFLHVASPDLLEQYLAAGARKFVFEGAECGGHIGPRASFPLWESQIDVLLAHAAGPFGAADLQILFAGGIHDARSAAMVSALAAPLTKARAAVGILMGTAYLFTDEAVACGAVRPLFQRQAQAAAGTEILETAPGHATRCLPSPYVETFRRRRSELLAEGLPKQQIWEDLEVLNAGRLRIASKGLRHGDAGPVAVDDAEQLADGLFMAGQVAVLRSGRTTVNALHNEVTAGAHEFLRHRTTELCDLLQVGLESESAPDPLHVAIIGMSCIFPGAPDLAAFWRNTVGNVDAVTEVPGTRWDLDTYFAPQDDDSEADTTYSRWGAFLPEITFDPLEFGIPPTALASIDPAQLLALATARRALEDAGYAGDGVDRSRIGVCFGAEPGGDLVTAVDVRMVLPSLIGPLPEAIRKQLPELTEDTFAGRLANVIAGRIANRLDLGGPNYTLDAACASSLAALDAACKELVTGTSDMMLCGAVDLHNAVADYLLFSSVGALSPTGRCAAFDAEADGIALGEGVACLVLKRLADAERDGDRVYAVIEGIGAASDGKAKSLVAPRPEGQHRALRRAYDIARISPSAVGLVEAHGTGTVVGDRTELETLTEVFAGSGATTGSCALGSVKSQIGHTKCAAGMAGLIRMAMAVHTGVKPPTRHIRRPNPAWSPQESPFVFHEEAVPWLRPPGERVAGVSAFGFGGTDFHAVLLGHTSAATVRQGLVQWPAELFTFRGGDLAQARAEAEWMRTLIRDGSQWRLRDLARTCALRSDRRTGPVWIALVASDVDDLSELLDAAVAGRAVPALFVRDHDPAEVGGVALLFPGQGSQRPGMLAELLVAFPWLRGFTRGAEDVAAVMYPAGAFDADAVRDREARLRDTAIAQPALGVTGLAMHDLLRRLGIAPDALAGHSYGELVALAAAGALDPATLAGLSSARAAAILGAVDGDPGGMAAVAADADGVGRVLMEAGLAERVVVANINAPRQTVVSGPTADLDAAVRVFDNVGLAVRRLTVACAFHSPVVAGAVGRFAAVLETQAIDAPQIPVWSNRTAEPYPADPDEVRRELAAQLGAPVRFAAGIEAMFAAEIRTFVEAGPGRVLSGLVDAVLGERPHVTVACDGGLRGLLEAAACLAVLVGEVRVGWLTAGRSSAATSGAPAAGWTVDGQTVRTRDGRYLPGGYAPLRREAAAVLNLTAGPPEGRDAMVTDFLRTSRELIAAQRDVLLEYLGRGEPAVRAPEPEVIGVEATEIAQDAESLVRAAIAERTGYPLDLIDPELDLEADLGIDSIKRTEIAGRLCRANGVDAGDPRFDEMVRQRTVRTMASVLDVVIGDPPAAQGAAEHPAAEPNQQALADPVAESETGPKVLSGAPVRLVIGDADAEGAESLDLADLTGQRVLVIGDVDAEGAESLDLADLTGQRVLVIGDAGAAVQIAARGALVISEPGPCDVALIRLGATDSPSMFAAVRHALVADPRWLVAVAPPSTPGLRGLFRAVAAEYPAARLSLIETDSPELPLGGGVAIFPTVRNSELRLAATGAGPASVGAAEAEALGLSTDSVVLFIGGGRGIAARCAIGIAAATGCRIELAGRTSLSDEPEDPSTVAATDLAGLRGALAGLGYTSPRAIEDQARLILARREIVATLAHTGSSRYHPVDVRDPAAVAALVKRIYADHGRLDGVVYAAGVIDDKLIADKDENSFRRVYETKVTGAVALLDALDGLPSAPSFTVMFGSVAAVFGNRGQADYAAANDAIDTLAAGWADRTGHRALTVHWGPWAPDGIHPGMVSPELARDYARRGVRLIEPEEGVAALLRELAWGPPGLRSVVYTATDPATWTGSATNGEQP